MGDDSKNQTGPVIKKLQTPSEHNQIATLHVSLPVQKLREKLFELEGVPLGRSNISVLPEDDSVDVAILGPTGDSVMAVSISAEPREYGSEIKLRYSEKDGARLPWTEILAHLGIAAIYVCLFGLFSLSKSWFIALLASMGLYQVFTAIRQSRREAKRELLPTVKQLLAADMISNPDASPNRR